MQEYLIDHNATQAAIRAGYKESYAINHSDEIRWKTAVRAEIDKGLAKLEQRAEVKAEDVIKELASIAFANTTDYAETVDLKTHTDVLIKPTSELSDLQKKAIKSIKMGKYGVEIELHDKVRALEDLGKHLGMFRDKIELSGKLDNPYKELTTEELRKIIGADD